MMIRPQQSGDKGTLQALLKALAHLKGSEADTNPARGNVPLIGDGDALRKVVAALLARQKVEP